MYDEKELAHLRKKDKKLGAAIDRIGMIKRDVNPDLFSSLVESIVGQQISNKAAATVCRKLNDLSGMEAVNLHALTAEEIQACGMSMRKAGYIKNIADAAVNKIVDFAALKDKPDAEIIATLTALPGVGIWTAEMILIFSLMRPNVVSFGDLAIRRGMMNIYGHKELTKERFIRCEKICTLWLCCIALFMGAIALNREEFSCQNYSIKVTAVFA
jgi:3-methyladenine DNA glycosylase/8-oxoguanine DNA glycosylase